MPNRVMMKPRGRAGRETHRPAARLPWLCLLSPVNLSTLSVIQRSQYGMASVQLD